MIDSDDVLLLKPAWAGAGLDLSGAERAGSSFGEKPLRNKRLAGLVVIWIHHLRPGAEAGFIGRFEAEAAPVLTASGAPLLAAFVTEHAENSFPRLPVRTNESVFVSILGFETAEAQARHETVLATSPGWEAFLGKAEPDLTKPTEILRLSPTSRSLLGK
ncbi:hypothetical protein [Mesorhizobium sp. B2-4-14]|uniref:hypothetical protein n=1 Tax=Mesorhizobium sp. B2-4-14 TaxID=2589935 RepID=UPI0032B1FF62